MAVQKLPKDIQTLVTASITINSFKTAVEELVYNALDSESTSIAVRVNITENTIQVIDNGCGITQSNFTLLGQRYATSKCVDLATLKSAPNKYGYKGQFLSSLVQVSRSVKVTSRTQDSEETWCKCFDDGRETNLYETANRPSKGTTVEVKDFLYNLNIRKNSINTLQELRDIKTFLEQLSLVHSSVSISLRDDSNNEIVFQMHKNRDIYQTLSTLFDVEKPDLQELIVEKNQYKTVAYIGKMDKTLVTKHMIYINGKLTHNSKLHKTINEHFVKMLHLKYQIKKKVKSNAILKGEENIPSNTKIPFYVILITCPYYDYVMSYTPKHSMLEFKNWECISNLLEKLVQFYTGDMKLKVAKDPTVILEKPKPKVGETRDQIRKIVEKMLGSTKKKPGVSQMQNGIKGKPIKRKNKNSKSAINLDSIFKIIPPRKTKSDQSIHRGDSVAHVCNESNPIFTYPSPAETKNSKPRNSKKPKNKAKLVVKTITPALNTVDNSIEKNNKSPKNKSDFKEKSHTRNQIKTTAKKYKTSIFKISNNNKKVPDKLPKLKEIESKITNTIAETAKPIATNDPLLEKFENQTTSVKRKCDILAKNVDDLLNCRKKCKREVFVNQTVQDNKTVSIRHNVEEIVVHDYNPKPQSHPVPCTFDNRNWKGLHETVYKTTYDLLVPILTTQTREHCEPPTSRYDKHQLSCLNRNDLNFSKYFEWPDYYKNTNEEFEKVTSTQQQIGTKLTYESHNYGKYVTKNQSSHTNVYIGNFQNHPREFITTLSKDNFDEELNLRQDYETGFKNHCNFQLKSFSKRRPLFHFLKHNEIWNYNLEGSEYTIEFSKSKENNNLQEMYNEDVVNNEPGWDPDNSIGCEQFATYTIIEETNNNDNNRNCFELGATHTIPSKTSHQMEVCHENQETVIQEYAAFLENQVKTNKNCYSRKPENEVKSRINTNENHELFLNKYTNEQQKNYAETKNENQERVVFISKTQDDNASREILPDIDLNTNKNTDEQQRYLLGTCVTVHSKNKIDENPAVVAHRQNYTLFNGDIELDSVKTTNGQHRNPLDVCVKVHSQNKFDENHAVVGHRPNYSLFNSDAVDSRNNVDENSAVAGLRLNDSLFNGDTKHKQKHIDKIPTAVGGGQDDFLFSGDIDLDSDKNTNGQERYPLEVCVSLHTQNKYNENPAVVGSKLNYSPFNGDAVHSQNNIDENVAVLGLRLNDSLFNGDIDLDSLLFDRNIYLLTSSSDSNKAIETHDLQNQNVVKAVAAKDHNVKVENAHENTTDIGLKRIVPEIADEGKETKTANFDLKNRPRFMPKGLSPIFENCQTKTISNYEIDMDYYEDDIYNKFANNVQVNTEIFEPRVQNIKELTTKDIEKVNSRINKDNASLIFDADSLKHTLVLGQVDNKFIAVKITGKNNQETQHVSQSLVLFDQHAVHERIRLEKNLSDYFNGKQWKSIALDKFTVKLSKEDILYLHNYRDKFMQFGLEWSISDHCEVSITAVPEAVLSKNPRQVDVIVTAVKNLIVEEICAIKNQKGCVTMYPRSIMELVFSEACRYAIKFGDRLSKVQCQEMISALSECKTPFQCAHGRPVMAVLIDIHQETREYKVNPDKLLQFSRKNKKKNSH